MLAIDAYRTNDISVVRAISHYEECTLGLCIQSLERMDARFSNSYIASGLSPMCNSFNACLDFAMDCGADILFHTASDVIVEPFALIRLLEIMDLEKNYLAVAKGYDPMFGHGASVGIWIWNMRVMGRTHRFRNVFKQDLDLCERVESSTGLARTYTDPTIQMGYHHPIWTTKDLYKKMMYSYPKYGARRKNDMQEFILSGLSRNPNNKVLLAGSRALKRVEGGAPPEGSKDNQMLESLFNEDVSDLHLDGSEYYVLHKAFRPYAMKVMGSYNNCVCIDDQLN